MAKFGQAIFGLAYFGDDGDAPLGEVVIRLRVDLEIDQRVSTGYDHDTTALFTALGDTQASAEVVTDITVPTMGATGALTVDATVEPVGETVDGGTANLGGSGALSAADPTIAPTGTDIDVGLVTFDAYARVYAQPRRLQLTVGRVLVTSPYSSDASAAALTGDPTAPSLKEALESSSIHVWRVVDILNADETMWASEVGFLGGNVNVDMGRDERRTLEITLDNSSRMFSRRPDGFWYDKIIRVRRGVVIRDVKYEFDLGYFMIDRIGRSPNGASLPVTGRDYTKKMLLDKLPNPTTFPAGTTVEAIVRSMGLNAGIKRLAVPLTGKTIKADLSFDADTSRWEVAKEVANAHGYDLYFSRDGALTMTPQVDPVTSPVELVIGESAGNAISFEPSTNDSELFNHVVAVSSNAESDEIPVWASVENNEPSSPTRIEKVGRRTKRIESALIETTDEAVTMARNFLRVAGLEQFEVSFSSLNYPWLDVGKIIELDDPQATPYDPRRYLLSSLDIPLSVGPMSGTCKRVTNVGETWEISDRRSVPDGLVWGDEPELVEV